MLVTFFPDIGCFVAFSRYEERDLCKSAGWRWDASTKRWFTSAPEKAQRLSAYADAVAKAQLELSNGRALEQIAASRAEDSDIDIPCPPGLSYLPYQRAGIAYAARRESCLIADEMGLGKTIQAIGVSNIMAFSEPVKSVLIVCPASLRLNWVREWKRWHTGGLRPIVVTDHWPLALRGLDLLSEPLAVVMSYEGAVKWKPQLGRLSLDILILDEAHYVKSGKAKRTKAIFGFQRPNHKDYVAPLKAKRRIALSGTPIVNRPGELWPIVHAFDPQGLGSNKHEYDKRYVLPPDPETATAAMNRYRNEHPRDVRGAFKLYQDVLQRETNARMAELHDRLRASFMIRRLKVDVLQDLPAKRRQIVLLDVENVGEVLRAEKAMLAEKAAEAQRKRQEIDSLQAAGDTVGHAAAVRRLTMWRGAAMTEISRIRHETALKKLPAVIDHLFTVLDEQAKVVIFGHHHDVLDGIKAALPDASVIFDGRMNDKEKNNAVARFQDDASCRLFIGSIRAAGLGITLTAASCVCFAELDWTPSSMVQAEDRCHRIGQRSSVFVQHLVVDESIDQKMAGLLISKAEMIDAILDGKVPAEAQQSVLDGVLA